jgi:hypothetical protein
MAFNAQYGDSPQTFVIDASAFNSPNDLGNIFETSTYGIQLHKLVDGGGVAGDVVYYKSYASSHEVTPTIGNSATGEIAGVLTATVLVNQICAVQKHGLLDVKANGVFARGTPVWPDSGSNRVIPAGVFSGSLGAAADTAGAIISMANPCTGAWLVTSLIVNRTTASTGAGTGDFGIAAGATTLNDGLIDGLDLNAAAASGQNNFANAGPNGKAAQYGAAGTFLTGSTASGNVAGLVGTYSGTFHPVGVTNARLRVIGIAQAAISSGKVSTFLDLPYAPHRINN